MQIEQRSESETTSDIALRVLKKQIDLLYSNQLFAVISTAFTLALLFIFLSYSVDWTVLDEWIYLFIVALSVRLIFNYVYFTSKSKHTIDIKKSKFIYDAGVISNAIVWAMMSISLFPKLDLKGQLLLMIVILVLAAAAHTTMGYRKLPIYSFSSLLLLSLILGINISNFPNAYAITTGILVYQLFLLRSAAIFYNHTYRMLCLNEVAIDRENELLLQREIANSANEAKSDFLSRMSHELRTPLNAVLGLSELQLLDKNSPLSNKQSSRARKIGEAGKHLLSIVNDVLDLSRIENSSMDIFLDVTAVHGVIKDSIRMVEDKAELRNIIIYTEMTQVGVCVMADPKRLKQIIVNLLDNAIKYNKHGGNVSISVDNVENQKVRISVVDTGHGLKNESLNELFLPFSRLGAEAIGIDGTGIGLSLCKELVELMNGSIGVNSRPGEGCCFWVEFPYVEDESRIEESVQEEILEVSAISPVNVLLVEDNLVNSEVAVDMLEALGISADVAYNGKEALEKFNANKYALILMDCEMPVMNGFTTTQKIREIETELQQASIPIIALTAHAITGAREKCIASGMDDFLSKPFGLTGLYKVLQQWLELEMHEPQSHQDKGLEAEDGFSCDADILDCDVLTKLYIKQKSNNSDIVSKIINIYLEQSSKLLDELTESREKVDVESIRKISHTLKSSSVNVGAIKLSEVSRTLERACEQGALDDGLVQRVYQDYADVEQALKDVLSTLK